MASRSLYEVLGSDPNMARGRGGGILEFQSRDGEGDFPHLQAAQPLQSLHSLKETGMTGE